MTSDHPAAAIQRYSQWLSRLAGKQFSELASLSDAEILQRFRLMRHRHWIQAAMDSYAGKPARLICETWSKHTESILIEAFQFCFPSHFALLVVGKLGSAELNISSDVDLQIVSMNSDQDFQTYLQKFQKLLASSTETGWCYRLDFDLRPGGRMSSVVSSLDQYCDYYGNYGETWERLALTRARVLCGPKELKESLEKFIERFIFRKYLDFNLMEDLKTLRKKIKDFNPIQDERINLKFVPGGIRDIELFVHALIVLNGGRNKALRLRSTEDALRALASEKLISKQESDFLISLYWDLRCLENYVQCLNDEHTHTLRLREPHPDFVFAMTHDLPQRLNQCEKTVTELLGARTAAASADAFPTSTAANTSNSQTEGFSENSEIKKLIDEIREIPLLSRQKERDLEERDLFLNSFTNKILESQGNAYRAIGLLGDFIRSTKAKNNFFVLLNRTPKLLETLAWIFSRSPFMSQVLISRPELLDGFVYRTQENEDHDSADFLDSLFERKLLASLIAGSDFLRTKDVSLLTENLSHSADEVARKILQHLNQHHDTEVSILALGKWGGREMGIHSDLDFVFVTQQEPTESDHRVAKRFVSWITELRKGGRFYSIDLRLRPEGSAGPMLISIPDLMSYLCDNAPLWLRQSYLKARLISTPSSELNQQNISQRICQKINEAIYHRPLGVSDLQEILNIRNRLLATDEWDIKKSPGNLLDIEFTFQIVILALGLKPQASSLMSHIQDIAQSDLDYPHVDLHQLRENYLRLRTWEQLSHLLSENADHRLTPQAKVFADIAHMTDRTVEELERDFLSLTRQNRLLLRKLEEAILARS